MREGFRSFSSELAATLGRPASVNRRRSDGRRRFSHGAEKHPDALNLLLIDSERPDDGKLFEFICQPQRVDLRLKNTVFWMVQCMEAWFLAELKR